nr:hypothetical protein [Snodgrassella alvi]
MTNLITRQYDVYTVLNGTVSSGRLFYQTDKPLIFLLWFFHILFTKSLAYLFDGRQWQGGFMPAGSD